MATPRPRRLRSPSEKELETEFGKEVRNGPSLLCERRHRNKMQFPTEVLEQSYAQRRCQMLLNSYNSYYLQRILSARQFAKSYSHVITCPYPSTPRDGCCFSHSRLTGEDTKVPSSCQAVPRSQSMSAGEPGLTPALAHSQSVSWV